MSLPAGTVRAYPELLKKLPLGHVREVGVSMPVTSSVTKHRSRPKWRVGSIGPRGHENHIVPFLDSTFKVKIKAKRRGVATGRAPPPALAPLRLQNTGTLHSASTRIDRPRLRQRRYTPSLAWVGAGADRRGASVRFGHISCQYRARRTLTLPRELLQAVSRRETLANHPSCHT